MAIEFILTLAPIFRILGTLKTPAHEHKPRFSVEGVSGLVDIKKNIGLNGGHMRVNYRKNEKITSQ